MHGLWLSSTMSTNQNLISAQVKLVILAVTALVEHCVVECFLSLNIGRLHKVKHLLSSSIQILLIIDKSKIVLFIRIALAQ